MLEQRERLMIDSDAALATTPLPAKKAAISWLRNDIGALLDAVEFERALPKKAFHDEACSDARFKSAPYPMKTADSLPPDRARRGNHAGAPALPPGVETGDVSKAPVSKAPVSKADAYLQKILTRKCLNRLVDVRSSLVRQNRLLELLLNECSQVKPGA
jgi:hypothetical protein